MQFDTITRKMQNRCGFILCRDKECSDFYFVAPYPCGATRILSVSLRRTVASIRRHFETNPHMVAVCLASLRIFVYNRNCEIVSERRNSMDRIRGYISIREASYRWGVSERRVNQYCADGRIPGAFRFGRSWAIPEDAKKPSDPRKADTNRMSRR